MEDLSWICGDRCTGCGACASICPEDCIKMEQDAHGFYVPKRNSSCTHCNSCEEVCPVLSGESPSILKESYFYGAYSKDAKIRDSSSSGGIFRVLADRTLLEGGIVFGAALKENRYPLICTDTDHVTIEELQKSKYVESDMGKAFKEMEKMLNAGRKVLFCGTPCQVMGARSYLSKHDNLLLCDFLCHGVPPIKAYKEYLRQLQKKRRRKIKEVGFRSKDFGWTSSVAMNVRFQDGTIYQRTSGSDPYFRYYYNRVLLRRTCYQCNRPEHSAADITLGDYWGSRNHNRLSNKNVGISVVGIHTSAGRRAFEREKERFVHYPIPSQFIAYAYRTRNLVVPDDREKFLNLLAQGKFDFFLPSKKYGITPVTSNIKELFMRHEKTRALMDAMYRLKNGDNYAIRLTIEEIQEITREMVKEIIHICEKNGLTYYMQAGSVLGTIRHGGPIPWDHDVDMIIPENEIKRFCKVMEEQLPEKYYLDCAANNKNYNRLFPRIGLTGAATNNVHVDCFRLLGIPSDRSEQEKFSKKSTRLKWMYFFKAKKPSGKFVKKTAEYILKASLLPFSRKWILRQFEKHASAYPYENSEYVMNPCGRYQMKNVLLKEVYGEGILKDYAGLKVRIPVQYESYLKHYYGDYQKFPPEEERNKLMKQLYEI